MDGETIRLIVVALGAIIAGLSGALIAGAFNSQNTQATIEAARVEAETQRAAEREIEHDRWLRDRKVDAYVAFINQIRDVDKMLREHKSGLYVKGTFDIVQATRKVNRLEVRLLAPENVASAAHDVMKALQSMFDVSTAFEVKLAESDAFDAAANDLEQKMNRLERLVSQDLGVPTTSDTK